MTSVTRTRTIQVLGAYTAETNTITEEADLPEATAEARAAWRHGTMRRLDAELDAWERELRAGIAARATKDSAPTPQAIIAPPPAAPMPVPVSPSPKSAYPPVEHLTPLQRVCSNAAAHKASEPRAIASNEYTFSVDRYGKPLCRPCQSTATPIQRRI